VLYIQVVRASASRPFGRMSKSVLESTLDAFRTDEGFILTAPGRRCGGVLHSAVGALPVVRVNLLQGFEKVSCGRVGGSSCVSGGVGRIKFENERSRIADVESWCLDNSETGRRFAVFLQLGVDL